MRGDEEGATIDLTAAIPTPGHDTLRAEFAAIFGPQGDGVVATRWRGAPWVMAIQGADLASRPTAGPLPDGIDLMLEPAGHLCVVPDRLWDSEAMGELSIRRRDGMPIDFYTTEAFARDRWVVVGEGGMLLGPLPAGTYPFEVRIGALRLADAVGLVRAGRVEMLRVEGP